MCPTRIRSLFSRRADAFKLCRLCQHRAIRTSARLLAAPSPQTPAKSSPAPVGQSPASYKAPTKNDGFSLETLGRPIGFHRPPLPGENSGEDTRSLKERRDDFVDWGNHLQRRKELTKAVSKPYFRDFTNVQYERGKSFLANPRVFRADRALFFPNFVGTTLADSSKPADTTLVLLNRISLVSVYSSDWALKQIQTWTSEKQNPDLCRILQGSRGIAQPVEVNIETNRLKYFILSLFKERLRNERAQEDWDKYFFVRKGITDEIRENVGIMNAKVGYVFLVDGACRIRWAGSGDAQEEEKHFLNKGLRTLISETTGSAKTNPKAQAA
ncbi:ATP10 protein-domain-containing protein [Phyllosticta citrichinensis]|uniref:ATP10 protein-domain-containing protein n=1 Tax=Phyllosticta citrichinensis TaxID=1130410 RepID=A0ABR1XU92_9PEZI